MPDGDTIAQVAVVVLLLSLSAPALATAHDYAGTPYEYSESVTVDYGNTTEVSEGSTIEGYGDNETVATSSKTLSEGEDYSWDSSTGTITWFDSANTADGESATVTYRAYQRTPQTQAAWTILAPLMSLFGLFGFISASRAVWEYTAEVWDL
mgnify:CR=1 FL=1